MPDFMLQEIKEQPTILNHLANRSNIIEEIVDHIEPVNRIYLTGCGDPYFAALTSRYYIEKVTNIPTIALPSMYFRWIRNDLPVRSLVIASSVSGRTKRTIEAIKASKEAGAMTIGITDNIDSPLTSFCDFVIETETSPPETLKQHEYAGYQYVVPQTKTYTAVMFVQMALGFTLQAATRENTPYFDLFLEETAKAVQTVIKRLEAPFKELGTRYAEKSQFMILGSGPYFGLAKYGAAKFLEYALPSSSQCLEEFNHQEIFLANDRWLIVFIAPNYISFHRTRELAPLYGELGARSLTLQPELNTFNEIIDSIVVGKYPEVVTPFTYAVPLQLLAFYIAKAKGLDVDEWCGGKRTKQIIELSIQTIRNSEII
ncbi:MAG: SIS domain-containing protein [Candidatus Heimdallarchaeota archaeon]